MAVTYIQKGTSAKVDILATFGIMTKSIPDMKLEVKNISSKDWADNQGDEEYIPSVLTFKAYEEILQFVYKGVLNTAGSAIRTFISYLSSAEFSFYDEFSGRGFRCRFSGYDPVATYKVVEEVVLFNIKVKINNPLSYAVKTNPTLPAAGTIFWDDGTSTVLTTGGSGGKTPSVFAIVSPSTL